MKRSEHRKEAERLLIGIENQLDVLEQFGQRGLDMANGQIAIGLINITIAKAHVHALLAQGEDPVPTGGYY